MYDDEIEKAVLFHIIFNQEQFELTENDFVNVKHKQIINAINELKMKKEEISILTIKNKINSSSKEIIPYLAKIGDYVIGTNAQTLYKILKEYTKKRQIVKLAQEIQSSILDEEDIDIYIEQLISTIQKIEFQTQKDESFNNQVYKTIENIEKNMTKKEDYSLYTGFFDLDNLTDGLHESEFTVIGARPAVGKTTFALQIAERIASKGKKVAYVSLEMSEEQIIQKILAKNTNINSRKIRNGDLTDEQTVKIIDACSKASQLPISILTKTSTIQQIELEARRMKNKGNLDLLVIDYLQLVRNAGYFKSREQEVADISRTLKLLSLDLEIPIIALCQLNRNANKIEPTLADIRESGAIEQDADNVIFLYKEDPESDLVTVDLQKQRSGNTGKLKLKFKKATSEFINIQR